MLYLEDYLEMIENLPMEMRDKFTEMREMDLQVSNSTDSIEARVDQFFKTCASGNVNQEWKNEQMNTIKTEYSKVLEDADEKVQLANQIYELVERHLRKLDQEVLKFKMELEADNAGITEILEKRLLEPEQPPQHQNVYSRPEKRKYSVFSSSITNNKNSSSSFHNSYNHHNHSLPTHNSSSSFNNSLQHNSHLSRLSSSSLAPELSRDTHNVPSFTRALNSNNPQQRHTNIHNNSNQNLTFEHHHQPQPKMIGCNLGSSNAAIVEAASRAIGATVEMQQGRRTSSLKASFEAYSKISKGLPREKELAGSSASSTHLSHDNKVPIRTNKRLVTLDKNSPSLKMKSSLTPNNSSGSLANNQQALGGRSSYHQIPLQQSLLTTNEPVLSVETELTASGWHADPNEPRYCICNDVSYGDMVGCDNEDCPLEWFHYGCVGLQQAPRGKWYCPQCTSSMKRRGRK